MSIYSSGLVDFDADSHADDCAVWVECSQAEAERSGRFMLGDDRSLRYDDTRPCTCGCGPIRYQGSHVLPADDDERAGSFSMCTIPGFIDRGPERPALTGDDHPCWPWLRVIATNDEAAVMLVLDAKQVREMRDQLTVWLDNIGGGDRG